MTKPKLVFNAHNYSTITFFVGNVDTQTFQYEKLLVAERDSEHAPWIDNVTGEKYYQLEIERYFETLKKSHYYVAAYLIPNIRHTNEFVAEEIFDNIPAFWKLVY